jgi:hypothetical protein
VWEDRDWLYEGQHGFRPGYSCESQIITVCQDISDSLDEAARLDVIIIYFSKAFDLAVYKWVPVTTEWRVLRLRMEERPPIWRVAANRLNKQSRTAD